MPNPVIAITGASSGIGAGLAELLGKKGARLVLIARRQAELEAVAARAGGEALAVVADVTRRADVTRAVSAALTLARTCVRWSPTISQPKTWQRWKPSYAFLGRSARVGTPGTRAVQTQ